MDPLLNFDFGAYYSTDMDTYIYKVVKSLLSKYHVSIFTFGSNRWRDISDFPVRPFTDNYQCSSHSFEIH